MHFNTFEEFLAYVNSRHAVKEARELKEKKPEKKRRKKDESVQTD